MLTTHFSANLGDGVKGTGVRYYGCAHDAATHDGAIDMGDPPYSRFLRLVFDMARSIESVNDHGGTCLQLGVSYEGCPYLEAVTLSPAPDDYPATPRLPEDRADYEHAPSCYHCHQPIMRARADNAKWVHEVDGRPASRGCRAASYDRRVNQVGEHENPWDDSLEQSWKAGPGYRPRV
jgi:hypothetical protein